MAEIQRPTAYVDRLLFAQRLVKSAQFRNDPKLAVRELCEAIGELTTALLDREQKSGQGAKSAGNEKAAPP
jgi:hypothetical protein